MAIYRSSDSVSRYDHQSEMYSLQNRPKPSKDTLNSVSETLNPSRKDTIEISKERLNEEALSKLGKKETYTVSQNSFMRIGKYLFLAVTLPPYVLVVGIPKWIVLQALPLIFSVLQDGGSKIAEAVKKPFMAVKVKIQQVIHFFREAALIFIRPVLHLLLEVKKGFDVMKKKVLSFFESQRLFLRTSVEKMRSILPKFSLATSYFSKIQHSLSKTALLFNQKIQLFFEKLGDLPKAALSPFQSLRQSWEQKKQRWKESFLSYFKVTRQSAASSTDQIFLNLQGRIDRLKKYFIFFMQFFSRYCFSPFHLFFSFMMETFGKIGKFFYNKQNELENRLNRFKRCLENFQTERWLDAFLSIRFPVWMKAIIKRVLNFPFIYSFLHFLIKNSVTGLIRGVDFVTFLIRKIAQGCKGVVALLSHFTRKISVVFLAVLTFVKNKKTNALNLLKKSTYYFLLGLIMSGILLKRGIILLGEITNYYVFYFSIKKAKSK